MTFYEQYFRCTRGGHWVLHGDAIVDKGDRLICAEHGRLLRLKPVIKGVHYRKY